MLNILIIATVCRVPANIFQLRRRMRKKLRMRGTGNLRSSLAHNELRAAIYCSMVTYLSCAYRAVTKILQ
jgi:hypothetical protein